MRRRDLFGCAAAALPLPLAAYQDKARGNGALRISSVDFLKVEGHRQAETGVNHQFQVNPLHIYDELRPKPYRDGTPGTTQTAISALYLKIGTTAGL